MRTNARISAIGAAAVVALSTAACADDSAEGTDAASPIGADAVAAPLTVPNAFTPVIASPIGEMTAPVLGSDGNWHVVYELLLTNASALTATIDRLEVADYADPTSVVAELSGDELTDREVTLAVRPRLKPEGDTLEGDDSSLEPNESMAVFVEVTASTRDEVPAAIVHRLVGTGATNPGSVEPEPIEYLFAPWALDVVSAVTIAPPLRGDDWVVVNGCCEPRGAHRTSLQTINGQLYDAQRFAIDWMRIGDNGAFFDGDPTDVSNWANAGADVLAVGDATVIEVLDELDDQAPGSLPDPSTITIETVDGNHVILDLGGGVYAFYAHLKRGSITVAEGDRVSVGDKIGELGNTGNTSGPHLHLHLSDRPNALGAFSVPYVIDGMTVVGAIDRDQWDNSSDALDDVWQIAEVVDVPDAAVLPLDLAVVEFGS